MKSLHNRRLFVLSCLLFYALTLSLSSSFCLSAADVPTAGAYPILCPETDTAALLLGGIVDGKWVPASKIAPRIKAQHYRLYSNTGFIREVSGGKPEHSNDWFLVSMPGIPEGTQIAIAGSWNATPRKANSENVNQRIYRDAVHNLLREKGLGNSTVTIKQAMKVDLEGDGQDEVILVAESSGYDRLQYRKGQYSFVALRRIVSGKVKTTVLEGDFHTAEQPSEYSEDFQVDGLWDVDGDGHLEIGIRWNCQLADVAGLALYDLKENKPVLLVKDGIGH